MTIAQNKLSLYTSAEQTERIRLDQINSSIEKTKQQVGGFVGRVLNEVGPGHLRGNLHFTRQNAVLLGKEGGDTYVSYLDSR